LMVCRDSDVMEFLSAVDAPGGGGAGGRPRRLFIAGALLYAEHNFGFNVFDLADPTKPLLVHDVKTTAAGWRHFVPTSTGLALAALGATSLDSGDHDVSLYRLTANGTDAQFLSTFITPGSAEAVAIAGARGYVA